MLLCDREMACTQISEHLQRILHVKSEDLRVYEFSNEDDPTLLENEADTINSMGFADGQKLLVESELCDRHMPLDSSMKELS